MNSQQSFEWQFGGWSGFPPWLGWTLILGAAFACTALAVWLYRDTLQALKPRQRLTFVLLRCGFFFALFACLAGPSQVVRNYDSGQETRPLAIVVDHSASMTTADSSGLTRLASAVRAWKESESAALHSFPSLRYFGFAGELSPAKDLEQAAHPADSGMATALFHSLDQVLQSAPAGGYGGIVCLTDGLDTTQASAEALVAHAAQTRTPLFFVTGENHQAVQESLIVRETTVPEKVLRKTEFNATAVVEAHTSRARDVSLTVTQDGQPLAQTMLHLRPGQNLVPWSVPVSTEEPGLIHLAWQLGNGAEQETVADTVPVVARNSVSVLFYQGTLDWGFRFINTALQRDASFSVTGLFNPDLDLDASVQVTGAAGNPATTALPDTLAGYHSYQIVVLANAYADQLSDAQQKALTDYVRQGGALLFLVSDSKMAQTFSGTALEAMLPVVFDPPPANTAADDSLADFQNAMHAVGGVNAGSETEFASDAQNQPPPPGLTTFALPGQTTHRAIAQLFGGTPGNNPGEIPKFVSYVPVASLKAGAEALAVHPDDKTPDHQSRALLVTQKYGQGQVTTLLTDALWRWKLSLPSTSHAPEIFWQQLFLAFAGPGGNMHFSRQDYFATLNQASPFALDGATGMNGPTVQAFPPGSATAKSLPLQPGEHPGEWTFQLTPDQPGKWRIDASDSAGGQVETLLRVGTISPTGELSGLPPDTDGLRKLAELTGGAMLNEGTPESWSSRASSTDLVMIGEHIHPVWDTWTLLFIALAFYAVELVCRRRAKLL